MEELYIINFPLEEIQDGHPCAEKYKQAYHVDPDKGDAKKGMEQMDQLRKLLEDLDKFWNMTSDPRYRGEHPKCGDIIIQLIVIF